MSYSIGSQARLVGAFTNAAGTAADPTTITLKIKNPGGSESSHVYGTDGNVIKDSTGNYHYDLTLTMSGTYYYRWIGTGAVIAAEENAIGVVASKFSSP